MYSSGSVSESVASPPLPAVAYLRSLNLDDLIVRICDAVPTIRTVVLTLEGPQDSLPFSKASHGPRYAEFSMMAQTVADIGGIAGMMQSKYT